MSYAKSLSIIGEVTEEVRTKRNKLAFRIDARVIQETPVDTSEARSSWIVSDGKSVSTQPGNIGPGQAITQGIQAINGAKVYTELFIQNNKPYIEELNEGSSKQAPSKYIDAIIAEEVAKNG